MKLTYKQIVALIYTIVLFLDRLDLTITNITLPTVAKYFNVSITTTDWINLAFLLSLATSITISSWFGERFGLKRVYIISIVLFGLGSTLCFFAPNLNTLIALRFIQGIGGGMLIPVGMTLIYRVYDKSEYASITSLTFIPALIAPAIAPFLGGVLSDTFGWRTVFMFSGPICLLLAVVAMTTLKEEACKLIKPLDWMGFILSAAILIDLFYTFSQLGQIGFTTYSASLVLALIPLIIFFILHERHTENPLIHLSYFKNKTFIKANIIQLCFQSCHFGAIFLIGMFLQIGAGFSATLAGLMMGMQAIGAITTSRYSVALFKKYGENRPITIGMTGIALITPCVLFINNSHMLAWGIVLFFVRGIFSGLCGTPIQTLSVIDFNKEKIATVNSIFNASRQVSISLGVAISSLLIAGGLKNFDLNHMFVMTSNQAFHVFGSGLLAITVISTLGVLICNMPLFKYTQHIKEPYFEND